MCSILSSKLIYTQDLQTYVRSPTSYYEIRKNYVIEIETHFSSLKKHHICTHYVTSTHQLHQHSLCGFMF